MSMAGVTWEQERWCNVGLWFAHAHVDSTFSMSRLVKVKSVPFFFCRLVFELKYRFHWRWRFGKSSSNLQVLSGHEDVCRVLGCGTCMLLNARCSFLVQLLHIGHTVEYTPVCQSLFVCCPALTNSVTPFSLCSGGKNTLVIHNTCEDSLLAAPIILDLVLLAELITRIEFKAAGEEQFHGFNPIAVLLSYLTKVRSQPHD